MKKRLFYILLSICAVVTGCIKDDGDATPAIQPAGKFTGQFIRIHTNQRSLAKDTVRVNVQLELVNNTFKITGDTTKHAGSKGVFNYNQSYIQWIDETVPAGMNSINLPKYHLNGTYNYLYSGSTFKFEAYNDTLLYHYDLKRQAD